MSGIEIIPGTVTAMLIESVIVIAIVTRAESATESESATEIKIETRAETGGETTKIGCFGVHVPVCFCATCVFGCL